MKETMNNSFGTEEKVLVTAIDHGFGNMKTVNTCFKTGVVAYDSEPTSKNNLVTAHLICHKTAIFHCHNAPESYDRMY